jgi:hypothetical protein
MAGGGMAHPPTAARLSDELEDAASTLRSNRHAADELGLSVPPALVAIADKVIE